MKGLSTVDIGGEAFEVDVHRRSKDVWVAGGDVFGERVVVTASNPESAVVSWEEAARSKIAALAKG